MNRELSGDVEMVTNKTSFNKFNNNSEDTSEIAEKEDIGAMNNETLKQLLEDNNFSSSIEWLQNYFKLSIHDPQLTPMTKVWLCLARLDGGSGQLLCQSMRWGIDGVRSWLASYIIWNASVGHDSFLPSNRVNFQRTISDLKSLIDQIHPIELKNDSMVVFIQKSLVCIDARQQHYSHLYATDRLTVNSDVKGVVSDNMGSSSSRSIQVDNSSNKGYQICRNVCIIETIQSIKSFIFKEAQVDQSRLGYLIPLHCGHNGWPSNHEINILVAFIKSNIKFIKR